MSTPEAFRRLRIANPSGFTIGTTTAAARVARDTSRAISARARSTLFGSSPCIPPRTSVPPQPFPNTYASIGRDWTELPSVTLGAISGSLLLRSFDDNRTPKQRYAGLVC